jgi:hypothetical protein
MTWDKVRVHVGRRRADAIICSASFCNPCGEIYPCRQRHCGSTRSLRCSTFDGMAWERNKSQHMVRPGAIGEGPSRVPITKLFTKLFAWGEGDSGEHVR